MSSWWVATTNRSSFKCYRTRIIAILLCVSTIHCSVHGFTETCNYFLDECYSLHFKNKTFMSEDKSVCQQLYVLPTKRQFACVSAAMTHGNSLHRQISVGPQYPSAILKYLGKRLAVVSAQLTLACAPRCMVCWLRRRVVDSLGNNKTSPFHGSCRTPSCPYVNLWSHCSPLGVPCALPFFVAQIAMIFHAHDEISGHQASFFSGLVKRINIS